MVTSAVSSSTSGTAASTATSTSKTAATSASSQNLLTALGSGSGIDTKALALSLVSAEKTPKQDAINQKITKAQNSISGYSAIKYVVDALKTAFMGLNDSSDFNSVTTQNSQSSAFSISTSASAITGNHTVSVANIAHAQRNVSTGFSAVDSPINGGNPFWLSLSVHGASASSIEIPTGTTTPAGVVSAINAAQLGVTAQLVNTGDPAAPIKIVLTGSTGTSNDFSLSATTLPPATNLTTDQGVTGNTESSSLGFTAGLLAGESVTIGGLSYKTNVDKTAQEVAVAFANLSAGATTGPATASGTYTGNLAGFSTGQLLGTTLVATSTQVNANAVDLAVVGNGVTITTTQGAATAQETSSLTFETTLKTGQSVTLGGLTYTATQDTTSAELAAAFSSLNAGATTGPGTAKGTYSGALTNFNTNAATGSSISAVSTGIGNVPDFAGTLPTLTFGTQLQAAQNAQLTVDGIAITSATNEVQSAIAGATLSLSSSTVGAASVNFARNNSNVKANVQALVAAYNDANSMLGVVSDAASTVDTYGGTLVGNSIVGTVRSQIRALITGDSSSPSGGLTALRDVGLSIDRNGLLSLDAAKLDAALQNKYSDVVKLFTNNQENLRSNSLVNGGIAGDAVKKLTALLASTGTLTTESSNFDSKIKSYKDDLAKLETRMASVLARYTKQFAAMDSIVGQTTSLRTSLKSSFDGMMASYTNK